MKYNIIEVEKGKTSIIKGYFVPNGGGRNGLLIRRNQEPHKGKPVDNLEIWEVFLTKQRGETPPRWKVQCKNADYPTAYGFTTKIHFPPATLFSLIECLQQVYSEIYGEDMDKEDVLSDTVEVSQEGPRPEPVKPGQKEKMKRLRELGF